MEGQPKVRSEAHDHCTKRPTQQQTCPGSSLVEHPLREQVGVGSNLGRAIPKALKMVKTASLLGAPHYMANTGFSSPYKNHKTSTANTYTKKKRKKKNPIIINVCIPRTIWKIGSHAKYVNLLEHGGKSKGTTCAVGPRRYCVFGCRPRITAFDRVITVNVTSDLAVDRDNTAVDASVDSRFLHVMVYESRVDSTGSTFRLTPVLNIEIFFLLLLLLDPSMINCISDKYCQQQLNSKRTLVNTQAHGRP